MNIFFSKQFILYPVESKAFLNLFTKYKMNQKSISFTSGRNYVKYLSVLVIFELFKIFGLAPINFKSTWVVQTKSWHWSFTKSKIGLLYNIFFTFTIISMNIVGIKSYYTIKPHAMDEIDSLLTLAFDVIIATNSVLILIAFTFQQKKTIDLGIKINQAREFAMLIDRRLYDQHNVHLSDVMPNFFINITILIVIMIFKINEEISILIYYSTTILNILIVTFTLFQYCIVVKITRKFLMVINDSLILLIKKPCCTVEFRKVEKTSLIYKLENLIKLRGLSYEISQKALSLYSFSILCSVFVHFLVIIYSLYFIAKDILFPRGTFKCSLLVNLSTFWINIPSITMVGIFVTKIVKEVSLSVYCKMN